MLSGVSIPKAMGNMFSDDSNPQVENGNFKGGHESNLSHDRRLRLKQRCTELSSVDKVPHPPTAASTPDLRQLTSRETLRNLIAGDKLHLRLPPEFSPA